MFVISLFPCSEGLSRFCAAVCQHIKNNTCCPSEVNACRLLWWRCASFNADWECFLKTEAHQAFWNYNRFKRKAARDALKAVVRQGMFIRTDSPSLFIRNLRGWNRHFSNSLSLLAVEALCVSGEGSEAALTVSLPRHSDVVLNSEFTRDWSERMGVFGDCHPSYGTERLVFSQQPSPLMDPC